MSAPGVVEAVDDLTRILRIERRPPVVCERDLRTKKYPPATQALVEVVTEKFARPRLSCACRPRRLSMYADGSLCIFRALPEDETPEAPLQTTARAFVADCDKQNVAEAAVAKAVLAMRAGDELSLPAADGDLGHPCITTLNAVQAWSLWEIPRIGGGLGFAGVGSGKSAAFMLFPLAFANCRLAVLLIEPNQRQHYLSQYLRIREHFRVPSIVFDDGATSFTVAGTPPLHLVPYSKLGNPASPEILDLLDPDVLLADEAHRLSGDNSSTGRRRQRRFIASHPNVRFVPMSGTLEDKSVRDTQPLATAALGMQSPLPIDPDEAVLWSRVMDPSNLPDRTSLTAQRLQRAFGNGVVDAQSVAMLLAGGGPEESIRQGFQKRRVESLGVISASATSIGAAIYFEEKKAPKIPEKVRKALAKVRMDGLRPDGDVIVEQTLQIQIAREVANGFYYFWRFTGNRCACLPDKELTGVRCAGCLLIDDWFARRKLYGKELRARLLCSEPHLDSPKLCMNAAVRAEEDSSSPVGIEVYCVDCRESWPCGKKTHRPAWKSEHWKNWGEIRNRVPHVKCVEWIDEYLARDAAEWAMKNCGVVWYSSVAFGQKVAALAGLPCHGGGPDSEEAIRAETGKRSVVASLKAWGKGLDGLQTKFNEQLLLEMMSSNRIMEQWLGRLHREGQRQDAVYTKYYAHVAESREALRKVLARAEFNETMSGNMPKILLADGDW